MLSHSSNDQKALSSWGKEKKRKKKKIKIGTVKPFPRKTWTRRDLKGSSGENSDEESHQKYWYQVSHQHGPKGGPKTESEDTAGLIMEERILLIAWEAVSATLATLGWWGMFS